MYLFKSIIISTIIYLFYKLFLQKETFFQSIRWYFIIGIVVSLLLPLLIIPIYVTIDPIIQPEMEVVTNIQEIPNFIDLPSSEKIKTSIDWYFWIQVFYLIGVAFFILKFIVELFSLIRLIGISEKRKYGVYQLVETNTEVSPFSFFNYIVYNKKSFKESELISIIEHEKVHVNQKHSIDNIFVQLFVILQWFNPFVWLYKKDLQQNLEYIADQVAQEKAETHKKYQYLLLKTSIKNNPFALSNNFFNSQLKKRIMMLQKSQTKKLNQLKYILLLPLIALFMYSFNTKEVYVQNESKNLQTEIYSDNNGDSLVFIQPIDMKNLTQMASGYGMRMHPISKIKTMHYGMDFSANSGTPIFASESGEVVKASYDKNYGKVVYIKHKNGFLTRYAHLSEVLVEKGLQIVQGAILGKVGNTGKSVAPHLHFEILKNGKNVNPIDYIKVEKKNKKTKKTAKKSNYATGSATFKPKDSSLVKQLASIGNIQSSDKQLSLFIVKETTNKELNNIKQVFLSRFSVVLKIYDVKRNKKDEITAIKIDGKKEDSFSTFSIARDIPIGKIKIRYKEVDNDILIANIPEMKSFDTSNVFETNNTPSGAINYMGKAYYYSVHKPSNFGSMRSERVETEAKLSERAIKNVAVYTLKGKTFYQYDNVVVIDFYDRFGNDVSTKLAKKLRKLYENKNNATTNKIKYKKEKQVSNSNNKPNNKLETKPSNQGWIYYKENTYFYYLTTDKLEFFTRYGKNVGVNLAKELLIQFNGVYATSFGLNNLGNVTVQEFRITKVDTLSLRKTVNNINSKLVRINDKEYTIDESKKIKSPINKFGINIKSIQSDELHGAVASGTTLKIDNENGDVRIVTFGGKGYTLDERPVSTKMGWLYYTMDNVEYEGYYFTLNDKVLFFSEKGIPLNKIKSKQIQVFLKSK